MTTFRDLQDEILQTLYGFGLKQPRASFLTLDALATDTSLTVISALDFQQGVAEIEDETIFIDSVDQGSGVLSLSPDGRGYLGTTAAAHSQNTRITMSPPWPRHRVKAAINDTITMCTPTLFGVAQYQFTFNPSQTTYELPAEADGVLKVAADVNGPSNEQQIVRRYRFNALTPDDEFTNQRSITLEEGVTPGKTVTVTYRREPSALTDGDDTLASTGLRETARTAIVNGACAYLLSFMDIARLNVDTAQADQYAEVNPITTATKVSGQLQLRFQMELEKERQRLRRDYPVPIVKRTR